MEENNTNSIQPQTSGDTIKLGNMDLVSPCEEDKQEEAKNLPEYQNQGDLASSSAYTNREIQSDHVKDSGLVDVKSSVSPEDDSVAFTTESPPHEKSPSDIKELDDVPSEKKASADTTGSPSQEQQAVDTSDGPKDEQNTHTSADEHARVGAKEAHSLTGWKEDLEATDSQLMSDGAVDQGDQREAVSSAESSSVKYTDISAAEGSGDGKVEENDSSQQGVSEEEERDETLREQRPKVEIIGPVVEEKTEFATTLTKFIKGNAFYLIALALAVAAVLLVPPHQSEPPPQTSSVDLLLGQMDKLKTQFPRQRAEFWTRSRIHLKRHLLTDQPTAPVNLILTAGVRAERTLQCLAQGLASAFSSAVNASVLNIDGASAASQDSDQVKLDIDSQLQGAFEGGKPVAVIHRFDELPPGSTLIFYRYCDHENAAFKESVLIFTVLLEDDEIPGKVHLNSVEEMVDDHLKKKFLTSSLPVSFDRMDLDKYSGLWSRISHLILPVAAETRIEHQGC